MLVFIFCRHQIEKKQEKLRSVKTNSLKINESNQKKKRNGLIASDIMNRETNQKENIHER